VINAVPLGEVAQIFNGKTPSKAEQRDYGHPVLKIKDVSENGLFKGIHESYVDKEFAEKNGVKKIRLDDTLILNAAHNADYVGSKKYRAEESVVGALATGEWLIARADHNSLHSGYLHHWLSSPDAKFKIRLLVKGIHLYPKDVARLGIPLPPLKEQKRIAAILDKADAIRRKRQQAIDLADQFLRSVFLDMFGDPITNPKGWGLKKFGDVTKSRLGKMLDARQQTGKFPKYYLRNPNVQWGQIVLDELKMMDFNEKDQAEFALRHGDLLICEGGEVGRAAIWRNDLDNCYYQKALHRVRPLEGVANSEYLCDLMWFLAKHGGLDDHVTSATIAHLTGAKLKNMDIPLPPFKVQQAYKNLTEYTHACKRKLNTAIQLSDSTFKSIARQAFKGELTHSEVA
jgi:type I restriction enzyme S subunit